MSWKSDKNWDYFIKNSCCQNQKLIEILKLTHSKIYSNKSKSIIKWKITQEIHIKYFEFVEILIFYIFRNSVSFIHQCHLSSSQWTWQRLSYHEFWILKDCLYSWKTSTVWKDSIITISNRRSQKLTYQKNCETCHKNLMRIEVISLKIIVIRIKNSLKSWSSSAQKFI